MSSNSKNTAFISNTFSVCRKTASFLGGLLICLPVYSVYGFSKDSWLSVYHKILRRQLSSVFWTPLTRNGFRFVEQYSYSEYYLTLWPVSVKAYYLVRELAFDTLTSPDFFSWFFSQVCRERKFLLTYHYNGEFRSAEYVKKVYQGLCIANLCWRLIRCTFVFNHPFLLVSRSHKHWSFIWLPVNTETSPDQVVKWSAFRDKLLYSASLNSLFTLEFLQIKEHV